MLEKFTKFFSSEKNSRKINHNKADSEIQLGDISSANQLVYITTVLPKFTPEVIKNMSDKEFKDLVETHYFNDKDNSHFEGDYLGLISNNLDDALKDLVANPAKRAKVIMAAQLAPENIELTFDGHRIVKPTRICAYSNTNVSELAKNGGINLADGNTYKEEGHKILIKEVAALYLPKTNSNGETTFLQIDNPKFASTHSSENNNSADSFSPRP